MNRPDELRAGPVAAVDGRRIPSVVTPDSAGRSTEASCFLPQSADDSRQSRRGAAGDLAAELKKQLPGFGAQEDVYLDRLLGSFLAWCHGRDVLGREAGSQPLVQIRLQLWLRELRRMVAWRSGVIRRWASPTT